MQDNKSFANLIVYIVDGYYPLDGIVAEVSSPAFLLKYTDIPIYDRKTKPKHFAVKWQSVAVVV